VKSRWVNIEAAEAGRRLVPAALEPNIILPLGFRDIQCASLTEWQGAKDDPEFRRLLNEVSTRLESAENERGQRRRKRGSQPEAQRLLEASGRSEEKATSLVRIVPRIEDVDTVKKDDVGNIVGTWMSDDFKFNGDVIKATFEFKRYGRVIAGNLHHTLSYKNALNIKGGITDVRVDGDHIDFTIMMDVWGMHISRQYPLRCAGVLSGDCLSVAALWDAGPAEFTATRVLARRAGHPRQQMKSRERNGEASGRGGRLL
jgi:hypothetical protein